MPQDKKIVQVIKELNIKTNNTKADRLQLSKILFQILKFPLIKEANVHKYANRLGSMDLKRNKKNLEQQLKSSAQRLNDIKFCSCCGLIEQDQRICYCQSLKEIDLPIGVKLYFMSIVNNAFILILALLIYGIFGIVTNIQGSLQKKGLSSLSDIGQCWIKFTCGSDVFSLGSKLYNEKQQQIFFQIIIGLFFILIWGFYSMIRRHKQHQLQVNMNIKRVSSSNFTFMLENVPKKYLQNKSDDLILQEFNKIFKKYQQQIKSQNSYEIVKINIARPIYNQPKQFKQNRYKLKQELYKNQQIFRRLIKHRTNHKQFPISLKIREQAYQNYLKFFNEKYNKKQAHQCPLEDKNLVFVTMKFSKSKDQILSHYQKNCFNLFNSQLNINFPIQNVSISKAPQPQQIIWKRVGFSTCKKIFRMLFIYILSFALLGVSFGISIGVTYIGINDTAVLSVIVSLVISLVDIAIQHLVFMLTFLEHQKIKSVQQASIALKISFSQLLNSIGVPIALVYMSKQSEQISDVFQSVYSSDGLVSHVFYISLFSLMTPIGRFIDPFSIYIKLKKWYLSLPEKRFHMNSQAQLNKHYACNEMDLGYEYVYIIKVVIFTTFFMPMQPAVCIFGPIGLGLIFLVNKYKLLYRFDRPQFHSFEVNNLLDWFFSFGPVALSLGQLFSLVWVPTGVNNLTIIFCWISFIISIILYVIPTKVFYKNLSQPQLPNWDFYQKQAVLPSDYDRLNPFTKQKAISQLQSYFNNLDYRQIAIIDNPYFRQTLMRISLFNRNHETKKDQKKNIQLYKVLDEIEKQIDALNSQDVLQGPETF